MFYNAKELQLELPSMQLDYITFGSGTRPLVMIQGLNTRSIKGSAHSLAFMYRVFAKEYKVYLFDRRPDIPEQITVRELAADIAMTLDALHIANADIFGVSQGGMIAQYLAIDRPDLVRKLALAVTLSKNNDLIQSTIDRWVCLAQQGNMKELIADMAIRMYSDAYLKRYKLFLPLLTAFQKPKDLQRFKTLANACLTCNSYEELQKIKCPVFVLGGKDDKIVGGYASEEIAEKLGCKIHMYEDLGHAAYEEAKDFNKRIYDFFTQ